MATRDGTPPVTGRIGSGPADLIRTEVLEPQLRFETEHLLPWYVRLEKVLLLEYRRMDVIGAHDAAALARLLDRITPDAVAVAARSGMSDIAFAVERLVESRMDRAVPAWHVDRSRNDLQAAAQVLHARDRLHGVAAELTAFARAAHRLAVAGPGLPMPGFTQLQPAQVISPGFYFAAVVDQVLHALDRLDTVYRTTDASPLGAGAMAGHELPWDRARMARLLGFGTHTRHALRAVATRDWALEAAAELSHLGVAVSRFATDLLTWAGAGHGYVDLPDAWSGISSAMPQKKNHPVLERIRGRTAHLTAGYVAIATGQRGTPFTTGIEVSKESAAQLPALFDTAGSVLRLFTGVLDNLRFVVDRMRAASAEEHLGGMALANRLTLRAGMPWRVAQVVAGRYIVAAVAKGRRPDQPDPGLLSHVAREYGHRVDDADSLLRESFDVEAGLAGKVSSGSANPAEVARMTDAQARDLDDVERRWAERAAAVADALAGIDRELAHAAGAAR